MKMRKSRRSEGCISTNKIGAGFFALFALIVGACWLRAAGPAQAAATFSPENTVIVADWADATFSQDYSVLLSQLRLEWIILDSPALPESVRDKNILLLVRPDAPFSGSILQRLLPPAEIATFKAADGSQVIETESLWMAGRTLFICAGHDFVDVRNAAEEAARTLINRTPPAADWLQTRYNTPLDEGVRDYVSQLTYSWDDAELSLTDLRMNPDAKPRWRISTAEAKEDVTRLFYLFAHGYAGYAFFNEQGEFAAAEARIRERLAGQAGWFTKDLAGLFHEELGFITDCHLNIGDYQYADHADFWYDTSLEVLLGETGYELVEGNGRYPIQSINEQEPAVFLFPSLNEQGDPIYRLGTLAKSAPPPLRLVTQDGAHAPYEEIPLEHSEFAYYARDIFREDNIGGIPVIRVRSFGDVYEDILDDFVATASAHKDDPVLLLDIRGNQGGNEAWPVRWIHGLTGRRADSVFVYSELNSKTSMAGRANLFADLHEQYPDNTIFAEDDRRHATISRSFEDGARSVSWTGPFYPQMPLIPNDTTLIVVMNNWVASAGEGLVMRVSQAENVLVLGENSKGCLTFGNAGLHQLPHSRMRVSMPINFGIYLDRVFREERGLVPDLWVPAADAVNYAVAAVRSGTITTAQPLPQTLLQQPFDPENPWAREFWENAGLILAVFAITCAGAIWAHFSRRKPCILGIVGGLWVIIGSTWLFMDKPIGFGFLLVGIICLIRCGSFLWRDRKDTVMSQS